MRKFIIIVVIVIVLLAIAVFLFSRGKSNPYGRTGKPEEKPRIPSKQNDSKTAGQPDEEKPKPESKRMGLLRQIADLEKKKAMVQEGLLYQKELGTIMESMQYLVGISGFLHSGGKLNRQQESNYFWYRIVDQCKAAVDNKESFYEKIESQRNQKQADYTRMDLDELQKIGGRLKKEVAGRNVTLSSRKILMALYENGVVDDLARMNPGDSVDWVKVQTMGKNVRQIFEKNEMWLWFNDDAEVQKYKLEDEFNEGSSIAIRVPGVFVKNTRTGSVEALSGYVGVYTSE